jgi:hypothetical protein
MTGGAGVAELPLVRPVSIRAFSKPDAGRGSDWVLGGLPVACLFGRLKDIISRLKLMVRFRRLLQRVSFYFQEDPKRALKLFLQIVQRRVRIC